MAKVKGISYFFGKSIANRLDDIYDRLADLSDVSIDLADRYLPNTADIINGMDIDPADRYLCS